MLCIAALCSPKHVLAHAGPQVSEIRFLGADQKPLLLSNRGIIFGSSAISDWALMCNEAAGVTTNEVPEIATWDDGRIMAATSTGLRATSDSGCTWTGVDPWATLSSPSIAQHPSAADHLYLTTYGPGQAALRTSLDAGRTWSTLLDVSDTNYLAYIRIAPSNPDRIYVRSLDFGTGSTFHYQVLRSDNGGKDWIHFDVSVLDTETDFVLLSVSPYDPDLIIAMAEAADPISNKERLLVSHDAGQTFAAVAMIQTITKVAFSADKQTIYVAADEGLMVSSDDAQTFQRVGIAEYLSCVQERNGMLLTCGFYHGIPAGDPGVGVSTTGGQTFDRWMNLNMVLQPLACDPSTPTASTCAPLWIDWEREILGAINLPDGGLSSGASGNAAGATGTGGSSGSLADAAADGGGVGSAGHTGSSQSDAGSPSGHKHLVSGCSCQVSAASHVNLYAMFGLSGVLLAWARHRRRKR